MKNKKRAKEKEQEKRTITTIAISEILILVIAIIAISWMFGSEIGVVSGGDEDIIPTGGNTINICQYFCGTDGNVYYGLKSTTTGLCEKSSVLKENCPNGCTNGICNVDTTSENWWKEPLKIGRDVLTYYAVDKWGKPLLDKALGGPVTLPSSTAITNAASGYGEMMYRLTGEESWLNFADKTKDVVTKSKPELLDKLFGNAGGALMDIFRNAGWGYVTLKAINWVAKKYASERNLRDIQTATYIGAAIGMAIVVPWAIGAAITNAALIAAGGVATAGGPAGWIAAAAILLAYGLYMLFGYQVYSREIYTFRVGVWQPPVGGADCNKCNSLKIAGENGCSEYICHSYGLVCEWLNTKTQYETCIEGHIGDIAPAIITPVKEIYGKSVFPNDKYDYVASRTAAKIVYNGEGGGTGKCVPAYSTIILAFTTNEETYCKIRYNEPSEGTTDLDKFTNSMHNLDQGGVYVIEHTLTLPPTVTADDTGLKEMGFEPANGNNFNFYIRCSDVRENINPVDYKMSFCVQELDLYYPEILGTYPAENSFIAYGTDKIAFEVYTDEPATCKWDTQRKSYTQMSNNFNKCSDSMIDPMKNGQWGCSGTLTGFKNSQENKYYIACKDHPEWENTAKKNERNIGPAEEIVLIGTDKLIIRDIKINGKPNGTTVIDSAEPASVNIEITTSGGAEDGSAICGYSFDKTETKTYSFFSNENNGEYVSVNTEELFMPKGSYMAFLKCEDIAGNIEKTMIKFAVTIDNTPPNIIRVYRDKDLDILKIITDETAICAYSNSDETCSFNFEDVEEMYSEDGKEHSVGWDISKNFYVKCKDKFGKSPTTGCSMVVRPFEIAEPE